MKIEYKISLFILLVLIVISICIAIDYDKYKKNNPEIFEEAIVLSDGDLSINFDTGNRINIKTLNEGFELEKRFSITNTGKSTLYYTIALDDIDNGLKDEKNLIYNLISTNEGANINDAYFPKEAMEITNLITISPETTQNYKLIINYKGNNPNNECINGMIKINSKTNNEKTFSDVILINNQVNKPLTKPGKEISVSKEGLISGNDDDGITYYFRGNVDNNYVKLDNNLWRIVRINGNKTIRLILDDIIEGSYVYNSNELGEGNDDYYSLAVYEQASIKDNIEKWYNDNFGSSAKYVVNSKFCVDTNINKNEDTDDYFNSYLRIKKDENPLHNCEGTIVTSNVGLLSVDEAIFAGGLSDTENKNSYLYNKDISGEWWLGSPYSISKENTVKMFTYDSSNGSIVSGSISINKKIRPVISIRDNVNVTGTGTKDDPYVIQ